MQTLHALAGGNTSNGVGLLKSGKEAKDQAIEKSNKRPKAEDRGLNFFLKKPLDKKTKDGLDLHLL